MFLIWLTTTVCISTLTVAALDFQRANLAARQRHNLRCELIALKCELAGIK